MLTRFQSKQLLDSGNTTLMYGHLLLLPKEQLHQIFSFLPVTDIGGLCQIGSTQLKDKVEDWISTIACCKQVSVNLTREMTCEEVCYHLAGTCRQYGLLCKRASMLGDINTRLMKLSTWYSRLERFLCAKLGSDWYFHWGGLCLRVVSISFRLGWDEAGHGRVKEWQRRRSSYSCASISWQIQKGKG